MILSPWISPGDRSKCESTSQPIAAKLLYTFVPIHRLRQRCIYENIADRLRVFSVLACNGAGTRERSSAAKARSSFRADGASGKRGNNEEGNRKHECADHCGSNRNEGEPVR